ncbi:transcription initiation factor IIA subunit 1-like [Gigantopelta aegis]|uniref:transcription initiation factor IIA subunit 1-like n=1 Tax=Gigantopelta aegis TaxID=1735272 RepID=UPI001B88DE61|nr:transcription initiation factor IIA subunit 1-like [Gigantopelta aegis]
MATSNSVGPLYKTVVEDVINNVKEAFLDEGVDEQVLVELKQLWETKLHASKALDPVINEQEAILQKHQFTLLQQQPHAVMTGTPHQMHQSLQLPTLQMTSVGQDMGAAATATMALPQGLFQQQFAALQNANTIALQPTAGGQYIQVLPQQLQQHQLTRHPQTSTITLPHQTTILQSNVQPGNVQITGAQVQSNNPNIPGLVQFDGAGDTSSSEDEFNDDDNDDDENDENNEDEDGAGQEEEPLNSGDDVSEEDPNDLFDTDNVVVCQYDKIHRNKNKWKFHLKDGIMNLNGRDYVFQKATGDSEW